MSSFEERERAYEAKFAHDEALRFRAEARRNKHLAHWASLQMGVEDANGMANYVAEVIAVDMVHGGASDVVAKIKADFDDKGVDIGEQTIQAKIAEFDLQAKEEILAEA